MSEIKSFFQKTRKKSVGEELEGLRRVEITLLSLCVSTKACRGVPPSLTAMRSRVPFTAAHRSCLRSITSMKPTSVEDKLEDTHTHTDGGQLWSQLGCVCVCLSLSETSELPCDSLKKTLLITETPPKGFLGLVNTNNCLFF